MFYYSFFLDGDAWRRAVKVRRVRYALGISTPRREFTGTQRRFYFLGKYIGKQGNK